jgi:hypothetical protein
MREFSARDGVVRQRAETGKSVAARSNVMSGFGQIAHTLKSHIRQTADKAAAEFSRCERSLRAAAGDQAQ